MKDEYIRFALLMSNSQTASLDKSICRLINTVFVDCDNTPLELTTIISKIDSTYHLSFSENEVTNAIKTNSKYYVFREKGYTITNISMKVEEYAKYLQKNNGDEIEIVLSDFNNKNNSNLAKELLLKFFYYVFNTNLIAIRRLCDDKEYSKIKLDYFGNKEKEMLQLFLKWKNDRKDRLILKMVDGSFEYCKLTMGGKFVPSLDMFKNKNILLDTNVILSLLGINGESKEKASKLFIKKCSEAGSLLSYSNQTNDECQRTIKSLCNAIKSFVDDSKDIIQDDESESKSSGVSNIYSLYAKWVMENDVSTNYDDFCEYLLDSLHSCLYNFKIITIDNEFIKNHIDKINSAESEIREYKQSLGRRINENSIKHDAINYLYLLENTDNKKRITEQQFYFSTLDTALCEWARSKLVGVSSNIIHLNVLFGILLRFTGRTDDDVLAFNEFVTESIINQADEVDVIVLKDKLLKKIKSIQEKNDYKKEIYLTTIKIVDKKIESGYQASDISENDVINEAYDNLLNQIEEEQSQEKEALINKYTKEGEEKYRVGVEQGVNQERNTIIEKLARERIKKIKIFSFILLSISSLSFILLIIVIIRWFAVLDHNVLSLIFSIIGVVLTPACIIINGFCKIFGRKPFDFDIEYHKKIVEDKINKIK